MNNNLCNYIDIPLFISINWNKSLEKKYNDLNR